MAPTQSKEPRKNWDVEQMVKAIKAVREKKMGTLKAAKTFKVPRTTLQRLSQKTKTKNKKGKEQKRNPRNRKEKNYTNSDSEVIDSEGEDDIPLDSDTEPDTVIGKEAPDSADAECMFCQQLFSENTRGELWVQCLMCGLWAHNDCAGPEFDTWICDFCK